MFGRGGKSETSCFYVCQEINLVRFRWEPGSHARRFEVAEQRDGLVDHDQATITKQL
jgi:hypothetical protein